MTRVKICGLTRPQDAELAMELGAHALGFVFEPTSPRTIHQDPKFQRWAQALPPFVTTVAVYGGVPAFRAAEGFTAIQGVQWPPHFHSLSRRIQAVRVRSNLLPGQALHGTEEAHLILLDAYQEGAYGGTGRCVDLGLARDIVARSARPVVLAGGLTPDNVAQAIQTARPYAVDVSSGVEASPGLKDAGKLRAFFQAVAEADRTRS